MSIFYKILENSKANKELIGLWKYNDDEGFWCGYVINFNENFIKIQHYTKFGKKDGIIIAQMSDIESVDFQDDYAQAMQYVIDNADRLDNEVTIPIDLPQSEGWQLEYLKEL